MEKKLEKKRRKAASRKGEVGERSRSAEKVNSVRANKRPLKVIDLLFRYPLDISLLSSPARNSFFETTAGFFFTLGNRVEADISVTEENRHPAAS